MPPREEAIRSQKYTDIYSVMLIVSAVFLLGAIAFTWHELSDHYKFMESSRAPAEETEPAPAEE